MSGGPRLGVLGGTFDPFHNGHLVAAVNVRATLGLDRVLVVVANRPWQKEGARIVTPAADRLAMARAGVQGVDGVEVSALEVERGGPTYTVDTLEHLRSGAVEVTPELVLVIGADVAHELDTWHRVDDIKAMVELAVVTRPGAEVPELPGWRVASVEIPSLSISSTDIRSRVADGRPIEGLVPLAVVREIADRGLYAQA